MNIILTKSTGKSLTNSLKRYKKRRKEDSMKITHEFMGEVPSISSKNANQEAFHAHKTRDKKILRGLNQIGHDKIAFVLCRDKNRRKKKSIWIFK